MWCSLFLKRPLRLGENRQNQFSRSATGKQPNFEAKWGVLKTSLARQKEASGVKYSPINQFVKGFTASLVVISYLSDDLENKQF